jgi:hypothetical protein
MLDRKKTIEVPPFIGMIGLRSGRSKVRYLLRRRGQELVHIFVRNDSPWP